MGGAEIEGNGGQDLRSAADKINELIAPSTVIDHGLAGKTGLPEGLGDPGHGPIGHDKGAATFFRDIFF
jgi:hypothetical protein